MTLIESIVPGFEAAVEGHDLRAGGQDVVGHALEQGLGQLFVDRGVGHFEQHGGQAGVGGAFDLGGESRPRPGSSRRRPAAFSRSQSVGPSSNTNSASASTASRQRRGGVEHRLETAR